MVSIRMLFLGSASMFAFFLFLPVAFAAPSPAYLSFSVPDSSATYPMSINDDLTITGYYVDSTGKTHGFVRCFDGRITVFDVPGSVETKPVSINETGQITGYYIFPTTDYFGNPVDVPLGFIRDTDGTITTFGNPAEFYFKPQPVAINRQGEVVGNGIASTIGVDAFIRSPTGTIQTFNINLGASYSTFLTAVNGHGDVVGYGGSDYLDSDVGFLWNGTGPLPEYGGPYIGISYPGSGGTFPTGINNRGEVVGCYEIQSAPPPSPHTDVYYDFLRTPSGTFTELDPPGTVPSCLVQNSSYSFYPIYDVLPSAVSLNNRGTVIGQVIDAANLPIGFVRFPDGKTIPFAIPGSTLTVLAAINNLDVLTGYYTKGGKTEGFIALP